MSGASLIVALLLTPPLSATAPASHGASSGLERARLTLWGTEVHWDDRWRAFAAPEVLDYGRVPVWERFETPSADERAPAPSFIVMREMDCHQHAWRTTGVVRYPAANLEGEASFERVSDETWQAAETGSEAGSIYGSVCRR